LTQRTWSTLRNNVESIDDTSEERHMRAALIAGAVLVSLAGPVSAGDQVPIRGSLAGTASITPSVIEEALGEPS